MLGKPKISAYTTARNCQEMMYPYLESIQSFLQIADEVVVLDSTDSPSDQTPQILEDFSKKEPRVRLYHVDIDWKAKNHGIFDGLAKGMARAKCTSPYLIQFDLDEVVHEKQVGTWKTLLANPSLFSEASVVALPVIDFWGKRGKARIDVNLWKWRVSVNAPDITHGIPSHLRKTDLETGLLFAMPGTDGCDYISKATKKIIPCVGFVPEHIENLRRIAIRNENYAPIVEKWFNTTLETMPGVFHYSWFSIERKIYQYKLFWTGFWKALYNIDTTNPKDNPIFPGVAWIDVTEEMIKEEAKKLEAGTTGWVFHAPWDGSRSYGIDLSLGHPEIMKEWISKQP